MIDLPTLAEPTWVGIIIGIIAIFSALVGLMINVARLRHELRGFEESIHAQLSGSIGVSGNVTVHRDELAQHQVAVGFSLHLLTHPSDEPYVVTELDLTNQGSRPSDLLACLVAGREIHQPQFTGLGREGREVEWEALRTSFWNETGGLFHGLSTTGNLFKSRSQLVRLDPMEREELLRLDAVVDRNLLLQERELHLIYKLFVVVRPTPPGITLSNQHHRRWRSIQYTLSNLNRFPFRLALMGSESSPGELFAGDPLGQVATQSGWRCFLLHHWDFEQKPDKGPPGYDDRFSALRREGGIATLDEVSNDLQQHFGVSDPAFSSHEELARAATYAAEKLGPMVDAWRGLLTTIGQMEATSWATLIQTEPWSHRWDALVREGYLFRSAEDLALFATPGEQLDPFSQERFAIRTKYVLGRAPIPSE